MGSIYNDKYMLINDVGPIHDDKYRLIDNQRYISQLEKIVIIFKQLII